MKNTSKSSVNEKAADIDAFDSQELFALVRLDMERGSFEQALYKIKRLIVQPDVPNEAFSFAARLYAQLGIWDRSKSLFEKYLQLHPQAVTEAFQLGMVHFDSGQTDNALKAWSDILQKYPTYPPALFYRALALAKSGKPTEARQNLDVLLASVPTDNLYFGRGKELLQALDGQTGSGPAKDVTQKEVLPNIPKDAYKTTEH